MGVVSEANARINRMGLLAKGGEHFCCFIGVCWFIEHAVVDEDDGIGGDEDFFLDGRLVVLGFVFGQKSTNFFGC